MNSMRTVMAFTIRNKVRNKSFIITTIVLAVLLVVVGNLPTLLSKLGGGDKPTNVGVVAAGPHADVVKGLEQWAAEQEKPGFALVFFDPAGTASGDEARLKQALEDGDVKGYLTFADDVAAGFPQVTYHAKSAMEGATSSALTAALQSVKIDAVSKDVGLTGEQKAKLLTPVQLETVQVTDGDGTGKTESEQGTAIGLTYVMIILLFMGVMITGQLIATEITAEKSSRVMELLVTSVSPLKQMFGKILGTFIVGFGQIVILLAAFVINLTLPQNMEALKGFGIRLDTIDPSLIVFAVFFYLTGFFLYATLFAAIGSIVSRTEDLGQAILPVTMLTLVGFYIAIFGLSQPEHILIKVCSFIPFFSPFLMFLRLGLAEPAWWEIALSIGILLVSILGIGWLSAKIYRTGVLMYGKRPSFKEVFKAMKAYKV